MQKNKLLKLAQINTCALMLFMSVLFLPGAASSQTNLEEECFVHSNIDFNVVEEAKAIAFVHIAARLWQDSIVDAITLINNRKDILVDNDIYVFAVRLRDGVMVAHPFIPTNVVPDEESLNLTRFLMSKVTSEVGSWAYYEYENPITGKPSIKKAYVLLQDGIMFGSGTFRDIK